MALPNRRVDVGFTGLAQQNRLTVLVRLILLIPQIIVLALLAIALFFVAIIGWFAALITGRLPEWAYTFMSGLIRWGVRVQAYYFLLTDRYPPFSFDDADYAVRIVFPAPGELNRLAVLFRFFLAIPAAVFQQIVYYGLTLPLLFVVWVIVLVSGQMPQPLYTAYSALLRYQTRHGSYFLMLTSEYPWGMLGDVPAGALPAGVRCRRSRRPMPQAPPPMPTAVSPAPASRSAARVRDRGAARLATAHAAAVRVGAHRARRRRRRRRRVGGQALGDLDRGRHRPELDDFRHRLGLDRLLVRERPAQVITSPS